jgi:iron complex transport system substrate-binding protein
VKRLIVLPLLVGTLLGIGATSTLAGGSESHIEQAKFPTSVKTAGGTVTIPSRPTRIMSLSATATEMLYAVGAGHQVVAVDKYSTDPKSAPRTTLTGYETGPESYISYHPDLILLAQDESGKLVADLNSLHIPTLLLPAATTLADTYQQFLEIGQATGHEAAARTEVASIKAKLDAIVRQVGTKDKGLTYYQELDPTLYTATSQTFIGSLYARLGMVNIADPAGRGGNAYPQLSAEFLLKANPAYVFLADSVCCGQSPKSFAKRPGFSNLSAVKHGHVFSIPDPIASEWGPRVVDFLHLVADDVNHASTNH